MLTRCLLSVLLAVSATGQLPPAERVNCHPPPGVNEAACLALGCIFDDTVGEGGAPWCYYPPEFGYRMYGQPQPTENGFRVELVKNGPASFAPEEFNFVLVEVEHQTDTRVRVKIHPNLPRWEVPIIIPADSPPPMNPLYSVGVTEDALGVFSLQVTRLSTGTVIFDTSLGGLTLADQFQQVGIRLPSSNLYGFGEHEHTSMRHDLSKWETLYMWTHDLEVGPGIALYGSHPHYTVVEDDGNVHSVLFLNSNAQEAALTPAPGIVYRTIGGVLDIYIFLGPTPEFSVEQYTEAVGRHPLPAYWALGFHLCRWGYNELENMVAAFNRTLQNGIPQDVQFGDGDVMERYLAFTYDTERYAGLPEFIDELHAGGRRFVVLIDPAVPEGEPPGEYPEFEDGMEKGVWVLDSNGEPLLGRVWPDNLVLYPDFSNVVTQDWWVQSTKNWHDLIAYDGLWIDMNEPSNFENGSFYGCPQNKWNNPPYTPKFGRPDINEKTLCMDATHVDSIHYNTHSMYGWWMSVTARKAIHANTGERGFVLSRSTFTGSGHYTAHWLGDNFSKWEKMKLAIIGIIEMNQFGIPLVGVDICGFYGDTTEELCARWMQVGAFYPFSRNHNERFSVDQDPGAWPSVALNARNALLIRYSIMPYLYTLFFSHAKYGGTVARPLWHEFPQDPVTLGIDEQFMLGPSFMISPALFEGQTSVRAYFPAAIWYDYFTRQAIAASGEFVDIDCPLTHIPLHIRGGAIMPTQPPELTTTATRLNNFELLVALDSTGSAKGHLQWDDGVTIDEELILGSHIEYRLSNNLLNSTISSSNYAFDLKVAKVAIWGVVGTVTSVVVNDGVAAIDCDWVQGADAVLDIDCGEQLRVLSQWTARWEIA